MTSISWVLERLTNGQKQGGGIPTVRPTRYFWHLLCHAFLLLYVHHPYYCILKFPILFSTPAFFSSPVSFSTPVMFGIPLLFSTLCLHIFSNPVTFGPHVMTCTFVMFSIPVMFGTLVMFSTRVTHLLSLASLLCSLFALCSVLCYSMLCSSPVM
jgi:hypothetical protein